MRDSEKRIQNKDALVMNGATFLLFQFIFWVCNAFPRHLLEINGWYSILAILLNSVYYVLYFFFILVVFRKNGTLFSNKLFHSFEPLHKRFYFKRIGLLLLVQLVFDAANLLLHTIPQGYPYILSNFITVLNWLTVYWIATTKEHNIFSKKKSLFAATVVLGGMLVAACIADGCFGYEIGYLSKKYLTTSVLLQASLQNIEFNHIFLNFLLDTGVGLILIVLHVAQPGFEPALHPKTEEEDLSTAQKVCQCLSQILLMLIASFFMMWVKSLIYPCFSYRSTKVGDTSSILYEEPKAFAMNTENIEMIRVGENRQNVTWYRKTKNTIQFNNTDIDSFYTVVDREPAQEISGNTIIVNNYCDDYLVDGTNVKVYKDHAICFVQNEVPVVIMIDDIHDQEKNDILTKTCESMLSDGNVSVFEYCCDYLLRCNSEVIENYIDRYAAEDFTENELSWMEAEGLKKDFIVSLAKEHK